LQAKPSAVPRPPRSGGPICLPQRSSPRSSRHRPCAAARTWERGSRSRPSFSSRLGRSGSSGRAASGGFFISASDLIRLYLEADPPLELPLVHRDLALHLEAAHDGQEVRLERAIRCARAPCGRQEPAAVAVPTHNPAQPPRSTPRRISLRTARKRARGERVRGTCRDARCPSVAAVSSGLAGRLVLVPSDSQRSRFEVPALGRSRKRSVAPRPTQLATAATLIRERGAWSRRPLRTGGALVASGPRP
jgi:hypothetical protein